MVLALSTEAAERGSNRTRKDRCLVAVLSLLPAVIFLWLSTVRLDAQGLYYDELHQAAGAFAYLGSPPEYFALFTIHGIPLLNMPYSGAIKGCTMVTVPSYARESLHDSRKCASGMCQSQRAEVSS